MYMSFWSTYDVITVWKQASRIGRAIGRYFENMPDLVNGRERAPLKGQAERRGGGRDGNVNSQRTMTLVLV